MAMIDDLPCQDLVELVTEYFEGKLSPAEHARFEAHLASCPPCRLYLEQMRQTVGALGRLSLDALAPSAREVLLLAFKGWKRE